MLARLLGRLISEPESATGPRLGKGPKDRRLTPDVLSRGTCLDCPVVLELKWLLVGVASSGIVIDDAVEPTVRFLERIVTFVELITDDRGDARGGVATGPGSLERAEWTRASSRCIWAVSERMWESEVEGGIL